MEPSPRTSHFARLLDRIRAGDPAAKEQLINDAYERVRALAHYILKGRLPAPVRHLETGEVVRLSLEDLLLRLREGLTRVPDNLAELFGYVDRIIRNVGSCPKCIECRKPFDDKRFLAMSRVDSNWDAASFFDLGSSRTELG
jgi:hypothetical protein